MKKRWVSGRRRKKGRTERKKKERGKEKNRRSKKNEEGIGEKGKYVREGEQAGGRARRNYLRLFA